MPINDYIVKSTPISTKSTSSQAFMGKDLFPMTEAGCTLLFVLSCLESNIGDDGMDGDIKGCMQLRSSFLIDLKRDKSQR